MSARGHKERSSFLVVERTARFQIDARPLELHVASQHFCNIQLIFDLFDGSRHLILIQRFLEIGDHLVFGGACEASAGWDEAADYHVFLQAL